MKYIVLTFAFILQSVFSVAQANDKKVELSPGQSFVFTSIAVIDEKGTHETVEIFCVEKSHKNSGIMIDSKLYLPDGQNTKIRDIKEYSATIFCSL